jgi:hypothetical protein
MQIEWCSYKAYTITHSKHTEPKTAEVYKNNLDKDTVDGFVEAIKARIIDEGNKIMTALKAVATTEALFIALLPIYTQAPP